MKTILALTTAFLSFAGTAQAHAIPDGTFRGEGLWRTETKRGGYDVLVTIAGKRVSSEYKLAGGETLRAEIELRDGENGFLHVIANGKDVGDGYCLEMTPLCHYELKTDRISLEETLTIQNGKLYAFGSKTESGVKAIWQERLEK